MKKVSILSLALFSIIFLSSCGGGSSPTGSSYNNETGSGEGSGNTGGGNNNGGGTNAVNITVSVVSTSSGNKYALNGQTTGSIGIQTGQTYTFTNSSNSAHPFRLSTTMDGTHAGGSTYGLGVTYSGDVLTFAVPSTAPTTLYYYCSVHSGMGGSATITISQAE